MYLAQEFDAEDELGPFLSPERERIVAPDLHSRMIGYLGTAPVAAPGFRTDGEWVWPEALVGHLRRCGAAPQRQLWEHMRERSFLLPDSVPPGDLAEAARASAGPVTPDVPASDAVAYFVGVWPETERHTLLRNRRNADGQEREAAYYRDGWERTTLLADKRLDPDRDRREYREVGLREAAALNDELWRRCHAAAVEEDRETEPTGEVRFARTYDGQSPAGTPWFSPMRLRLPEPARRERLAAYLSGGRLVVRATGHLVDPLEPELGPVVPLSFRTDGVWVWQEALAYYLRRRGVAPELELLCHIEERGYRLPDDIPADAVDRAAAAVRAGPRPVPDRPAMVYYDLVNGGDLHRARSGHPTEVADARSLDRDQRWRHSDLLWRQRYYGSDYELEKITEEDAVRRVDDVWARFHAGPPQR